MVLRIGIPVECQNGHKAIYKMVIIGLEVKELGVDRGQNCGCPKFGIGEGWRACGKPFVLNEEKINEKSI